MKKRTTKAVHLEPLEATAKPATTWAQPHFFIFLFFSQETFKYNYICKHIREVEAFMAIKKTFALLSVFVIALLVAGCGQQEAAKPAAQDQAAPQQAAAQDSTGLDQSAVQQEETELNTNELSDIDAGLSEIENI